MKVKINQILVRTIAVNPCVKKKKEAKKNFTSLTARGKEKVALLVCAFVLQDTLPSS